MAIVWLSLGGGSRFCDVIFFSAIAMIDELTMNEEVLYLKEFQLWELNNEFRYI